jgi:geranylgeranyl pyrophosphate synthase
MDTHTPESRLTTTITAVDGAVGPAPEGPPAATADGTPVARASAIYAPIRVEMAAFEAALDRVIEDAPGFLREELTHALKGGGKRLRPALVLLSGALYPERTAPLISMALGYELLHTATLVHDDTVDNALTRRGMLTVNRLWGNSRAVLVGDYLCGCSAMMTAQTASLKAMEIFSQALGDLCGGAVAEHVAGSRKSREDYFITISRKTASLFAAATESGAVLSKAPAKAVRTMRTYGYSLGMAFQTLDDMHDYRTDMSQGGITLPAILLLEQPQNRWLADLLDRDAASALDVLIEKVADSGVLEECGRMACDFCDRARASLGDLPPGPVRYALGDLVGYVMDQKP